MSPSRVLSVAILTVVTAAILSPALPAAPVQNIPGSSWAAAGTMKATVSAQGESDNVKGPVDVLLRFGPQAGILAGEFVMTIDDGEDTLVFGGVYVIDGKGKPRLTLSESSAAAGFLDLWDSVVDDVLPGASLPTPTIDISKARLKAKPKARKSGDTIKIQMSSKWSLDFFTPQHIRVKMKLKLKAKNGERVG